MQRGGDPVRELKSDLGRAFGRPFLFAMLGSMLCVLFGAFSEVLLLFQAQPPAAMLFQHRAVTLRALSGSAMLFAAPLLAPIPEKNSGPPPASAGAGGGQRQTARIFARMQPFGRL